jgi:hypothetical protein
MTARPSRAWLAALLAVGACGEGKTVEPDAIPASYTDWYRVDTTGAVPGHGDTHRIIYANETARSFSGTGSYANGTIIVKEVRDRDGDQPGALRYIAVMRKLGSAPSGGELQDGWLFTYLAESVESAEENRPSCYDTCHVVAPIDNAFLDYGFPHGPAVDGGPEADGGPDIDAGDEADGGLEADASPDDIDAGV